MLMVIEFIRMNGKGEQKEERKRKKMLLSKSVFFVEHKIENKPNTDPSLVITVK